MELIKTESAMRTIDEHVCNLLADHLRGMTPDHVRDHLENELNDDWLVELAESYRDYVYINDPSATGDDYLPMETLLAALRAAVAEKRAETTERA